MSVTQCKHFIKCVYHFSVATSPTKGPMLLAVGLQSVAIQTQTPIPLHCILCQAVEKDAADCEKQFVLGMRIQR